jgi:hypothetical protein
MDNPSGIPRENDQKDGKLSHVSRIYVDLLQGNRYQILN